MNSAKIYLIFAIIGAIVPYGFFIPWLRQHGMDLSLLLQHLMSNNISLFAWADVIISAIALIVFILKDKTSLSNNKRYSAIAASLLIGPSCGLPLYLYFRSKNNPY